MYTKIDHMRGDEQIRLEMRYENTKDDQIGRLWPYITTNVDCFLPRKPISRALLIKIICMLISFQKSKSFINRHRNMTGINSHFAENTISIDDKKSHAKEYLFLHVVFRTPGL
ncbi:hypothetical protein K501DRAFT_278219 [Backusella circina FSU 941]|nr:hypothetical protein K501DRAFT_278219 [Backusella circina FSU 941]